MKPDDTVKLPTGETGTIVRPSSMKGYHWVVRVHGALSQSKPPAWEGEIEEDYRAEELVVTSL